MTESSWKRISKDDVVAVDQCVGTPDYQFTASNNPEKVVGYLRFQTGNPADGINGVTIEALLEVIASRLDAFQQTEFNCAENAEALEKVLWARDTLYARTQRRKEDGTAGTQIGEVKLASKHLPETENNEVTFPPRLMPVYKEGGFGEDAFVSPDVWPPFEFTYGEDYPLLRPNHLTNFLKVGQDIPNLLSLCTLGARAADANDEIDHVFVDSLLVKATTPTGEQFFKASVTNIVGNRLKPTIDVVSERTIQLKGSFSSSMLVDKNNESFEKLYSDPQVLKYSFNLIYNNDTRRLTTETYVETSENESGIMLEVIGFILDMELANFSLGQ